MKEFFFFDSRIYMKTLQSVLIKKRFAKAVEQQQLELNDAKRSMKTLALAGHLSTF